MLEGPLLGLIYILIAFGLILLLYVIGYIVYKIHKRYKNKKKSSNTNQEPLLIENNII